MGLKLGLPFVLGLGLSACATLPNAITEEMEGHQVEYVLVRHEAPSVIFENGLGGDPDWWGRIFPAVAQDYITFAYNRPGYGKSTPPKTPRDGQHIVEELRGVLRNKRINPPYVLVGHSLGGLYMQYFARRYPGEVAALVLVDSTHPEQLRGRGAMENWPWWFRLLVGVVMSSAARDELHVADLTGQEVLALPAPIGKPVILLNARNRDSQGSDLAQDAYEKRVDLARLYPGATVGWVESGHGIPLEKPGAVIDAIRAVAPITRPDQRARSN